MQFKPADEAKRCSVESVEVGILPLQRLLGMNTVCDSGAIQANMFTVWDAMKRLLVPLVAVLDLPRLLGVLCATEFRNQGVQT